MEPEPSWIRNASMTKSEDDAARSESRESVFSPIPILMMIGGGFATLVLAKAGWDLLRTYGGL